MNQRICITFRIGRALGQFYVVGEKDLELLIALVIALIAVLGHLDDERISLVFEGRSIQVVLRPELSRQQNTTNP